MGYYKDLLQKYYDNFYCDELSLQERMINIKTNKEKELEKECLDLKTTYDKLTEYPQTFSQVATDMLGLHTHDIYYIAHKYDVANKLENSQKALNDLQEQGVVDYFKGFFEKETDSLKKYEDDAFTTMGKCVEKMASVGKGIGKFFRSQEKIDNKLVECYEVLDSSNTKAEVCSNAQDEWEELRNSEKVVALVTRYELTGKIEFSASDMDNYAKSVKEAENASQDCAEE